MGYLSIKHLYKCSEFFDLFKEVYAMEKIHGTSTWIYLKTNQTLIFHSGGETSDKFKKLFNEEFIHVELKQIAKENDWVSIKIHGEAYGGKQQGMKETYGPTLKFIVFDVLVSTAVASHYLTIPAAETIAKRLGLEFVDYVLGPNTKEWLEEQTQRNSVQAVRNGILIDKPREGIVIRTIDESTMPNGERAIFKHKNDKFWEVSTPRLLGIESKIIAESTAIVDEWVTEERLKHVVDKMLHDIPDKTLTIKHINQFLNAMVADIKKESENEIVWHPSGLTERSIKQKASYMYREFISY